MTDLLAVGVQKEFQGGWALIPFVEKPHFWIANGKTGNTKLWRSRCGTATADSNESVPPLELGNFPKCKLCARGDPWS